MLYVTCTTITSVDLAHYGVSRAKGWVSVDSTIYSNFYKGLKTYALVGDIKMIW